MSGQGPSLSYDGTDLGQYGLVIGSKDAFNISFAQETVQLFERSYSAPSKRTPKTISLEFSVLGTSPYDLLSKLDVIRSVLGRHDDRKLTIDSVPGRFWMARTVGFSGATGADNLFEGDVTFLCPDPLAYDTVESVATYAITASPQTLYIGVGGSAHVRPTYTLTTATSLSSRTITVASGATNQSLTWTGSIAANTPLIINTSRWHVTYGGNPSMATVGGAFPQLAPGAANPITVTNFGTTGQLVVTYRNAYQ